MPHAYGPCLNCGGTLIGNSNSMGHLRHMDLEDCVKNLHERITLLEPPSPAGAERLDEPDTFTVEEMKTVLVALQNLLIAQECNPFGSQKFILNSADHARSIIAQAKAKGLL